MIGDDLVYLRVGISSLRKILEFKKLKIGRICVTRDDLTQVLFHFNYMGNYINIPVNMIRSAKTDKSRLELIAFSILIKSRYKSSCIKDITVNKVSRMCHCSKKKAKELVYKAQNTPDMFEVSRYGITARSFKKYRYIDKNWRHQVIYHANVARIGCFFTTTDNNGNEVIGECKLRDIVKKLREALFLNTVNGFERGDKSSKAGYNSLCETRGMVITQRHIANMMGMKRTAAVRIVKNMDKKGKINIFRGGMVVLSGSISNEALNEVTSNWYKPIISKNKGFSFIIRPNSYEIADRNVSDGLRHIIYGHSRRLTLNRDESKVNHDNIERFIDM